VTQRASNLFSAPFLHGFNISVTDYSSFNQEIASSLILNNFLEDSLPSEENTCHILLIPNSKTLATNTAIFARPISD
jgi:hypothetical protein